MKTGELSLDFFIGAIFTMIIIALLTATTIFTDTAEPFVSFAAMQNPLIR